MTRTRRSGLPEGASFAACDRLAVRPGRGHQIEEKRQWYAGGQQPQRERGALVGMPVAVHDTRIGVGVGAAQPPFRGTENESVGRTATSYPCRTREGRWSSFV